ncbi:MAG TPA: glycosyltransferase family 2 protein [Ilumatobacter sp.]
MTSNPLVRSVSAFFPCYNDQHSIPVMVRDVRRSLVGAVDDFEIIVVDDGSVDDSLAVLTALASEIPELRVIRHDVNRGYGGALLSGFAAARKEWIFYTDGDAQYDASEITRCIDAVTDGVDVVQGWKIARGDPWYRKLIGRTYHHVVKFLFRLPVRDTDCDFRFIHSRVMEKVELTSTSGVICVEMMHAFDRIGVRFVEVGVSHHARPHGRSQFFRIPAIARSAKQLMALWWRVMITRRSDPVRPSRRPDVPPSDVG